MTGRVGFVGTGAITAAMVTGLGAESYEICVSPRNATIARDLAARFGNVTVASSNQDVLDRTDTIVVAVRPVVAAEILTSLRFRPDHRVISVVSGLSLSRIAAIVAPARTIVRAVPLPSVANRMGPTVIHPSDGVTADLFNAMGTTFVAVSEDAFETFCAVTATIAPFFAFVDTIAVWITQHGISEAQARDYTVRMMRGLVDKQDFQSAVAEHATPGGINEQLLQHLLARRTFDALTDGLDAVLRRISHR